MTSKEETDQDARYRRVAAAYGGAILRLARGYEADADLRRDLVQDVHAALWRSFASYDGRCSERTWVYRVAHNAAVDHVRANRRLQPERLVDLDGAEALVVAGDAEAEADARIATARMAALIRGLRPADRQVILLYLEDIPARQIAEVTGLKPGAVAVRIHRIKALLSRLFSGKE